MASVLFGDDHIHVLNVQLELDKDVVPVRLAASGRAGHARTPAVAGRQRVRTGDEVRSADLSQGMGVRGNVVNLQGETAGVVPVFVVIEDVAESVGATGAGGAGDDAQGLVVVRGLLRPTHGSAGLLEQRQRARGQRDRVPSIPNA